MKDILASIRNPAWVSFAWFGMTAGISLLEAPVKFTAPTITREVALDVGRVVFAALHKAEFIALILLLILVRIGGRSRELFGLCAGLATIMIIQSVWLLPELSSRAQSIIEGVEPGPSIAHAAYSILELLKLLLLLYFGFRSMHTAIRAS
jgi:hypothetical protein